MHRLRPDRALAPSFAIGWHTINTTGQISYPRASDAIPRMGHQIGSSARTPYPTLTKRSLCAKCGGQHSGIRISGWVAKPVYCEYSRLGAEARHLAPWLSCAVYALLPHPCRVFPLAPLCEQTSMGASCPPSAPSYPWAHIMTPGHFPMLEIWPYRPPMQSSASAAGSSPMAHPRLRDARLTAPRSEQCWGLLSPVISTCHVKV
ncbi:uncharacterized protein F5Z01DRAFT_50780 [Emericellopsis atlantica]|uniref:Uncharacterized protein n=1 Tax=Emericellopsis atlantica TaxID=2614577 RepID=A0A9P7ZPB0_9HYPO|nr:uncharacterized protein F5Z01DRAFT_50780 [Emericellopsis atlantica]KAG9255367.1 hypothetical protein F5Z01DRAFT_50780 [Emericellopsis atlantica]